MDERWRRLLAGYLDNELSEAERREFEAELLQNAELRAELAQFKQLKKVTDSVRYADLPDEVWESYWSSVYRKLERGIGWVLFSVGAILLIFYGCYRMLTDMYLSPNVSIWVKAGITGLLAGTIILLVSLVRERFFAYRHDRYGEVLK